MEGKTDVSVTFQIYFTFVLRNPYFFLCPSAKKVHSSHVNFGRTGLKILDSVLDVDRDFKRWFSNF